VSEISREPEIESFKVGDATFGDGRLTIIAGPCVVESPAHVLSMARECRKRAQDAGLDYVFKASYDKANRSSGGSFRGIGVRAALDALRAVRDETGLPIVTDVHDISQIEAAAEVADMLQIPAFLCRQTDLIVAAVKTGRCQHQEGTVSRAAGRAQHRHEGARRGLPETTADGARRHVRVQ